MARLSLSRAWDETKAVLGRDRGPIATVALALMVLPGVVSDFVVPPTAPGTSPGIGWSLLSLLVLLITIVGQLTISRIAVGQRTSVGEAMSEGVRRSPGYLLALLLWLLPFALLAAYPMMQAQANPAAPPPSAMLALVIIALVFMVIGVRLVFTTPVAANEVVSPVAILKRSWRLTAGNWLRLFGFLVLFMIMAVLVLGTVTLMVGVVVKLIAGEPQRLSVGALIISLVGQLAAAAITVLLTVMLTRLYLQVAQPADEPVTVPHAP